MPIWKFIDDTTLGEKNTSNTLNSKNPKNQDKKSSHTDARKTTDNSPKKTVDTFGKKKVETPAKKIVDSVSTTTQTDIPTTSQQKEPISKEITNQFDFPNPIKIQTSFNTENELEKLKIPIPLIELINKNMYIPEVIKTLNIGENTYSINLNDGQPELLFGLEVEGKPQEGGVPPFYVSLNIHDKILHNVMIDSGDSHIVMPKDVMEKIGLDITRPYKDLYSFDCNKVRCLGLIKDLCVTLAQILAKSLVMERVAIDIPPKYGMLLSCSWGEKLQGTVQMDMIFATIPLFG